MTKTLKASPRLASHSYTAFDDCPSIDPPCAEPDNRWPTHALAPSRKSGHASLRAASVGDESGVPPVARGAPGYRWPGSRGGGVRAGSGGRCAVPAACCGCEASGFALWLWRGVRECMVVVRRLSLLPTPGPFVAVKEIRCGGPPGGHPPLLPCARVSVSCTDEGPGRRRAVPVIYSGAAVGGGCV